MCEKGGLLGGCYKQGSWILLALSLQLLQSLGFQKD